MSRPLAQDALSFQFPVDMMFQHEDRLAWQLQQCSATTRQLTRQIRSQKRVLLERQRSLSRKNEKLMQVGLRILLLASHSLLDLERWLHLKMPTADVEQRQAMTTSIVDRFNEMAVADINVMFEPLAKQDTDFLRQAKAELVQLDLHRWVCEQNNTKGVAPSVRAIIKQKHREEPLAFTDAGSDEHCARTRWAEYKWIARWTHKWKMPKSTIHDRDTISPEHLRDKASMQSDPALISESISVLNAHFAKTKNRVSKSQEKRNLSQCPFGV